VVFNLNTSEGSSALPGMVCSVVLEKDGEDLLDQSFEK
jgi:hypothetical protein